MGKFKEVVKLLIAEVPLPAKNRNHKLQGNFKGYWECHIEPDWLIIYKRSPTEIIFTQMGSHADLF